MTPEEYAAFTQYKVYRTTFVQPGNSSPCFTTSIPWVIDSGASDHLISRIFSNFSNKANNTNVTVANGLAVKVGGVGMASLSSSISLSSTIYIPNFPFNLISVSQFTKQYNCSITFYPDSFIFQDLATKKTIGRGRVSGGLYLFDDSSSIFPVCYVFYYGSSSSGPLSFRSSFIKSLQKIMPSLQSL